MSAFKIICEKGLWCVKYYVNTNLPSPSFYQTFACTWNTLGMYACLLYRLEGQGKKKYLQETYTAQWETQALWLSPIWSIPWAASLVSKSLSSTFGRIFVLLLFCHLNSQSKHLFSGSVGIGENICFPLLYFDFRLLKQELDG